jgi:hypothetical protein
MAMVAMTARSAAAKDRRGAVGEVLTRENLETIYRATVRVLVDAKDGTNAFRPG